MSPRWWSRLPLSYTKEQTWPLGFLIPWQTPNRFPALFEIRQRLTLVRLQKDRYLNCPPTFSHHWLMQQQQEILTLPPRLLTYSGQHCLSPAIATTGGFLPPTAPGLLWQPPFLPPLPTIQLPKKKSLQAPLFPGRTRRHYSNLPYYRSFQSCVDWQGSTCDRKPHLCEPPWRPCCARLGSHQPRMWIDWPWWHSTLRHQFRTA